MSSVSRAPANVYQGDAFFVNLNTFTPELHTLDASGNPVEVAGVNYGVSGNGTYSAGSLFLRDMGKTIRVPGQTTDAVFNGNQRLLRKVQVVGRGTTGPFPVTNHFINFTEGVSGSADVFQGALPSGYATFFVDLSGHPSGCNFARINLQ
jgi:hypothetical protein